MKREKKEHYEGLDANSAEELARKLTEMSERLKGKDHDPPTITPDLRSALFVWYEIIEEPETLKEKYELEGKGMTCADCQYKEVNTDGRNKYQYKCLHKRPGTNENDPACNWFYIQMEGEKI